MRIRLFTAVLGAIAGLLAVPAPAPANQGTGVLVVTSAGAVTPVVTAIKAANGKYYVLSENQDTQTVRFNRQPLPPALPDGDYFDVQRSDMTPSIPEHTTQVPGLGLYFGATSLNPASPVLIVAAP